MEKARQHTPLSGGLLPACALGLALLLAGAAPATAKDPVAARADALLEPLYAAGQFSGAVVIGRKGKVVYARGFGMADRERGTPFTPDTANDGGSLAKPVTAAMVLWLAQEGRIELDAPMRRYLPEYPHEAATVRQLLSHSDDLPDYGAFQALLDSGRPVSSAELLAEAAKRAEPPAFAPGTAFSYCNLCYDALAMMVERVTGERYDRHVGSRVFRPLGIEASFLRPARFADWPGPRTRAYRKTAKGVEPFDALDNEGFYGGGNLYFTARDLHAWVSAFHTRPVLPQAVRRQASAPTRIGAATSGLTLGNWYCAAGPRCYYTGHHQGFHNFGYWDGPRRLSVAFVSNNTLSAELQPRLARALIAIAEGREPGSVRSRSKAAGDAAAGAGRYRAPDGSMVEVSLRDSKPFVTRGGLAYRLYPAGNGVLYAPGLDAYLTFDPQVRGHTRLHWTTVFEDWDAGRIP